MMFQFRRRRRWLHAGVALIIVSYFVLVIHRQSMLVGCDKADTSCRSTYFDSIVHVNITARTNHGSKLTKRRNIRIYQNKTFVSVDEPDEMTKAPNVLIVATYRGGSSFTGKLLDLFPQSFYWFEPLAGIYMEFFKKTGLRKHPMFNGYSYPRHPQADLALDLQADALTSLRNIFNCDVHALSNDTLLHYFIVRNLSSRNIRLTYSACLKKDGLGNVARNLDTCIPSLRHLCMTSSVRSIKTIRLSLSLAHRLMGNIPDLKVIHLIRDPRGVIQSRHSALHYGKIAMLRDMNATCTGMVQDISEYARIQKDYPDRIFQLRFEDMALKPIQYANMVYSYIGLHIPESVKKWLTENTHSAVENDMMGFKRNATVVVHKWKERLSTFDKIGLKQTCSEVIEHYGYETD